MKLPILLKSLQPAEYKEFEKFLQSPFFKDSAQYLKFFKYLCKRHPTFELKKADLQAAFRRCFGEESPSDPQLHNLCSGLGKQIEQYLVVSMVLDSGETTDHLYDQLLVKSLGIRNMGAYFRKESEQLIEAITGRPVWEIEDYFALQKLHEQVYYNPDTPRFQEHPPHLKLAVAHLDLHFCMAKLRYVAEMKARERLLNVHYELPLLEAVLEWTSAPELLDKHPILAVYHQLVRFYLQGLSEPGFRDMLRVFRSKFAQLSKIDQTTLLKHLINCGISLIARDAAVETELLSLYKMAIGADLLLDGNRITHLSFINIANLGSLCKDFDWVKAFIAQFSPYLEDSKRQASIDLANAGLYYNQGMLDEAQTSLTPDIFSIQSFDILGRILLIRIVVDRYIMQGNDYEFLTAQLNAFEKFVQSKPLTAEKKDAQLNWIKFVRKMAVLKRETVKVSEAGKARLRMKLEQLQPIVSKKWLREKIEAL